MQDAVTQSTRIFVTGHRGLLGSAMMRLLREREFANVLTAAKSELDLRDRAAVQHWFQEHRPEAVIHLAGIVGGIAANIRRPVSFLTDNMLMTESILCAAHAAGTMRALVPGSSCMYPRLAPQPIAEESLQDGKTEPTNSAYAIAKIAGLELCQAYRKEFGLSCITPIFTNLYGPNDKFDDERAHVLPALLRRFYDAKLADAHSVAVWGTGTALREFLYVDDAADACLFLLQHYDDSAPINVGTGKEISIRALAESIRNLVHPRAEIVFDPFKPDGMPRKRLDVTRLSRLGWTHKTNLEEGLQKTFAWLQTYRKAMEAGKAAAVSGQDLGAGLGEQDRVLKVGRA